MTDQERALRKVRNKLKGKPVEFTNPVPLAVFLSLVRDGFTVKVSA